MKLYEFDYLGYATADRRLSNPMIPWILAEIRKGSSTQKVSLGVHNGRLECYDNVKRQSAPFMSHQIHLVCRHLVINGNVTSFGYFVRDVAESILYCHLFQSSDPDDVVELVAAMRDQANSKGATTLVRNQSSAAALTSLCADISPSSSHFFEVFYIGKIRVNQKKVAETFIDDTLENFWHSELQKEKKNAVNTPKEEYLTTSCQETETKPHTLSESSSASSLSLLGAAAGNPPVESQDHVKPDNAQAGRIRPRSSSLSNANSDMKSPETVSKVEDNRTMVFLVGHTDLHLISPDRKQVLLHKQLRDVVCCLQGAKHKTHFGFICKEAGFDYNIGFVFNCQSESVADELVVAISQAQAAVKEALKKEKQPVLSCDHCPMVWYHKLCADIENQSSDKRIQSCIFRRLDLLPEEEQEVVLTKLRGAEALSHISVKEQNQLLMMLLRAHCESKQSRHVHDTAENRHEFLNHYLGSSTIFMKAKRSLTSSFDQLLKRKGSKDDLGISENTKPITKELSLPMNAALCKEVTNSNISSSSSGLLEVPQTPTRPRSSTISSLPDTSADPSTPSGSPMMNIFLKVGNSPKEDKEESKRESGSWRQAIFKAVVTPGKPIVSGDPTLQGMSRRDKADLRALWRKAINQQVLLIRMERENARLKASQEEATVKRIKLEYDDLGALGRKNIEVWEMIINKEARKADEKILMQAIRQGVPRSKRGEIWVYLAERHCANIPPFESSDFPNYNVPYENLLKQLTSQQHAILIDLGRTFPKHTYFSSPLGPGQLALYNLLKAYSLLDPQVGYCQGLSFVAGILLLHMSEDQAFVMLRHLMFRRQLRAQYLPDMVALQVQLYQLSRLLHDSLPDLYLHLDHHEVAPTLFAAPWLLTVFASQFPLGFVTRVFDLLFLEGKEVLFRFALALLTFHKDGLLACDSFELIMNYLKSTVPHVEKSVMDKILKEVFISDISKKLLEYEVEYHVLQEEANTPRPELKRIKQLEELNKQLVSQNRCLTEQLEIATSNVQRLETSRSSHMMQLNRLESQVRSLEVTVSTLGDFISTLVYNNSDIEVPGEILRIAAQLNVSERKCLPNNVLRPTVMKPQTDEKTINPIKNKKKVLKSTVSSPNLQPVSSIFDNSNNSKLSVQTEEINSDMSSSIENPSPPVSLNIKSLMNSDDGKELKNSIQFKASQPLLGRILTEMDKKALGLLNDDSDSFSKSKSMPSSDGKRKLVSSQSSYELGKSGSATAVSDLPLNSDTVNICFGGTTKLRTIRPLKARNESCSSIPSQSSSTGSLFETCSTPKGKIELQIIEPSDEVVNMISVLNNNHDDFLFANKSPPKGFGGGKEAEQMINSQLHVKPTSLLT